MDADSEAGFICVHLRPSAVNASRLTSAATSSLALPGGWHRAKKELSPGVFPGKLAALMQQVNVAIIGGGTVGGGVFQALQRNGALMASRLGLALHVTHVAVRDLQKARAVKIPASVLTA